MSARHVALIVEDEPEMAAELADLLDSFGHDHRHAATKAEALELLGEGGLCYVLLDLQIKARAESMKPRVEAGMSLLREIRRRYPARSADGGGHDLHLLPVLAVSGKAKEHEDVVAALQLGADDFVRKPLGLDDRGLGPKIRRCLSLSGRSDHAACDAVTVPAVPPFRHSPDYGEVTLNGEVYLFTGFLQRDVVRLLHEAARRDEPWQFGKAVLPAAGSDDMKMGNLFRRHPCWSALIESNGRGLYRLKTA